MPGGSARLACLVGALVMLSLCASAQAGERIINGQLADPGEYPAQGFLELTRPDGTFICGGSLVSNRHFLTAAHCATFKDTETPLSATDFTVTLGKVDRNQFTPSDERSVALNQVNPGYDASEIDNDLALLTLSEPAPAAFEPVRLVETGETGLWQSGAAATIIGWGTTESGFLSRFLLEATVPMQSDASCGSGSVWGTAFHPASMVCAGIGDTDTCGGDSGGPLLVSDGAFLILAGTTSWGADPCGQEGLPGVYSRLGAPALNQWVRELVPMARASVSDATPDTGQAVTFSVTTTHPGIPAFTALAWDFDSDGVTDSTVANPSHSFPAAGEYLARVTATGSGPDTAVAKVAVRVSQPPPVVTPTPTPAPVVVTPPPTPTPVPVVATPPPATEPVPVVVTPPPATEPMPRARLATILAVSKPQVRRGRFRIRVNFAETAPRGTAVIEVFRGKRKIGGARARVRRGGSRQVVVKLTKAGKRLLRRSTNQRLKVKVQVRVKRQVLRSKTLTIRL